MMQQTLFKSEDLVSDNSFMKKLIDNSMGSYPIIQNGLFS